MALSYYTVLERDDRSREEFLLTVESLLSIVEAMKSRDITTLGGAEISSYLGYSKPGGSARQVFGLALERLANAADGGCAYYAIAQGLFGDHNETPMLLKTISE
jgi:hypothetical protein